MEGNARTRFTANQKAELWDRWKNGQCVADIAQTLASCGAAGKEILIPRPSLCAGLMGAAASAGRFTAFAIEGAANVRTLGLVELISSYVVSLKLFREKLSAMELGGMALISLGIVVITLRR